MFRTTYTIKLPFIGLEEADDGLEYAQEYVKAFQVLLDSLGLSVTLKFEELESPEFYDNDNDKIYCKISEQDLLVVWNSADKDELRRTVWDRFESPTQPTELYPYKISEGVWLKPVTEWDLTMLETLLQSIMRQHDINLNCEAVEELMDLSQSQLSKVKNNG